MVEARIRRRSTRRTPSLPVSEVGEISVTETIVTAFGSVATSPLLRYLAIPIRKGVRFCSRNVVSVYPSRETADCTNTLAGNVGGVVGDGGGDAAIVDVVVVVVVAGGCCCGGGGKISGEGGGSSIGKVGPPPPLRSSFGLMTSLSKVKVVARIAASIRMLAITATTRI